MDLVSMNLALSIIKTLKDLGLELDVNFIPDAPHHYGQPLHLTGLQFLARYSLDNNLEDLLGKIS